MKIKCIFLVYVLLLGLQTEPRSKPGGGYVTLGDLVENDKFMEYCRECEVSSLGAS